MRVRFTRILVPATAVVLSFTAVLHAQAPPKEDHTLKNVQVLKGIPEPELREMMTYMRSSLGVLCNYCHVNSRETGWQYEKDDKENKRTARKMIQMVLDMNKNYFDGRTEVTCFTCHEGHSQPVSVPTLPVMPPAFAGRRGEGPPKRDSLPSPDALIQKYRAALGGEEKIAMYSSRMETGTVSGPNGQPFPLEVYQKGPNKMVSTVTLQQGTIMRSSDGTNVWGMTPQGPMEMSDIEKERFKVSADLLHDIDLKKQFETMATVGKDSVDGRSVYVVRGRVKEGVSERLMFDEMTGLLRRRTSITRTLIGIVPEQADFEDYRDVDGMKMPFKVRYSNVDAFTSSTRMYTEIKLNVSVDDAKFAMPR